MDISGYVAGLSMAISQTQFQQSLGIAVTRKAMDVMQTEADALVEMISAAAPSFGHVLDVKV